MVSMLDPTLAYHDMGICLEDLGRTVRELCMVAGRGVVW